MVARGVKGLINVEFKNYDVSVSTSPLAATYQYLLCVPTQGDSATQREGRSIKVKSLQVRYQLTKGSTQTIINRCKVMVVKDTMPDGSTFSMNELLDSTGDLTAFNNLNYGKRFKVIYSRTHVIDPSTSSPKSSTTVINVFKKVDSHVKFQSSNGNITDITANAFYLIFIPETTTPNSEQINFAYSSRSRFIDN